MEVADLQKKKKKTDFDHFIILLIIYFNIFI